MHEVPAPAGKSQLCSNRSFVATSGARRVQFYKLKNTVCAVGLIAGQIGLYRKKFSLIIFLGLRKVMCIRVRGLCLVFLGQVIQAVAAGILQRGGAQSAILSKTK